MWCHVTHSHLTVTEVTEKDASLSFTKCELWDAASTSKKYTQSTWNLFKTKNQGFAMNFLFGFQWKISKFYHWWCIFKQLESWFWILTTERTALTRGTPSTQTSAPKHFYICLKTCTGALKQTDWLQGRHWVLYQQVYDSTTANVPNKSFQTPTKCHIDGL